MRVSNSTESASLNQSGAPFFKRDVRSAASSNDDGSTMERGRKRKSRPSSTTKRRRERQTTRLSTASTASNPSIVIHGNVQFNKFISNAYYGETRPTRSPVTDCDPEASPHPVMEDMYEATAVCLNTVWSFVIPNVINRPFDKNNVAAGIRIAWKCASIGMDAMRRTFGFQKENGTRSTH